MKKAKLTKKELMNEFLNHDETTTPIEDLINFRNCSFKGNVDRNLIMSYLKSLLKFKRSKTTGKLLSCVLDESKLEEFARVNDYYGVEIRAAGLDHCYAYSDSERRL